MSDNSYLKIGEIVFKWRYQVPTFITFLFSEDDIFIKREELEPAPEDEEPVEIDPDELNLQEACFRTTVAAAKSVLDGYGYTLDFFAGIYDSFRPDLQEAVRDLLDDQLGARAECVLTEAQLRSEIQARLTAPPDTALGDLKAFTSFLREAIARDYDEMEPFVDEVVRDRGPGHEPWRESARSYVRFRWDKLADFESLQMLAIDRADRMPASILRPLALFDEGYMSLFPEVVSLVYVRLLLDATADDAAVELDVKQVVETERDVRSMHSDLAHELLLKVDVYERVFRALSEREEDVQDRYARTQVRNALEDLGRATDAQSKGEALESLMASAFSIKPQLQVVERNYSTGDEEIDLIVKNNVARPFWHGLNSPLLLVECKNWTDPVGAPEIRNFEIKLQNHAPMTRIGLLVAPGGFTGPVDDAIKRSSRDPYAMVLATGADLERLAHGGETVLDWLEGLLSRPI